MSHAPQPDEQGVRHYGPQEVRRPEDPARCIIQVWPKHGRSTEPYQCTQRRGHGPNGHYCRSHNPDAIKARQDASLAEHRRKEHVRTRPYRQAGMARDVLKKIAAGHGDPRALAKTLLECWDDL